MTHDAAVDLIRASGLHEADRLVEMLRPSVRIRAERLDREPLERESTFGGRPLLPVGMEWPHWDATAYFESNVRTVERMFAMRPQATALPPIIAGYREQLTRPRRPLRLLADLSLSDLPTINGPDCLPPAGRLLFFYDVDVTPAGFDPADRGGWQVLYVRPDDVVARATPPAGVEAFPACALTFDVEQTLAMDMRAYGVELVAFEEGPFADLYADLVGADGPEHRQGGYADPVQGSMELECQLVTNGLYCGDQTGYADPRRAILEPGAKDWRLLLQLDTDDAPGWMWGDVGRVYFWIRDADLRSNDFGNVWCVFQCH